MEPKKKGFLFRNGLGLVLLALMLMFWTGQALTGWNDQNNERLEGGQPPVAFSEYLCSYHFWAATAENWESEFLQMGMYVLLTVSLYQVGSSESKDPDKQEEVDREPKPHADAPWPVRQGGIILTIYKHSLSMAFLFLFALSFILHFRASLGEHNTERLMKGLSPVAAAEHIGSSRFWFESFQNWQSEFMAVLAIVVLSIHLREMGSPESKPVDAAHGETGS